MVDFQLDFEQVTAMQQLFLTGVNQMDDTLTELRNMAALASDGALLGEAGDAFYTAIMDILSNKVSRIQEKFNELAADLQAAMDFASGADTTSAGRFNG